MGVRSSLFGRLQDHGEYRLFRETGDPLGRGTDHGRMKCIRHLQIIRDVASMTDAEMIDAIVQHAWRWTVDHTLMIAGA